MEHALARVCYVCILWGSQNCPYLRDLFTSGLVYRLPSCLYRILRLWCFHFLLPERAIRLPGEASFIEGAAISRRLSRAVFNWTRVVIPAD